MKKLSNIQNQIKNALRLIIYILNYIKKTIETFLGIIFPPFRLIYKCRDLLFQTFEEEQALCISKMPKWFEFCETSLIMRGFRVMMGIWVIVFANKRYQEFLICNIAKIINIDINHSEYIFYNYISYSLTFFCVSYFCFFQILKLFLTTFYVKTLVYNSPFSAQKCVFWGISKICRIGFIVGMAGFGGATVDSTLRRRGYVEVFDGYFQNSTYKATGDITYAMGTEIEKTKELQLQLFKGTEFPGANLAREWGQNNTLQVQQEHHDIYQQRQQAASIVQESAELIKNNKYKKE